MKILQFLPSLKLGQSFQHLNCNVNMLCKYEHFFLKSGNLIINWFHLSYTHAMPGVTLINNQFA